MTPRLYWRRDHIPDDLGTAVTWRAAGRHGRRLDGGRAALTGTGVSDSG
ncbi:hypothetical protein [Streptomyces collinus]